MDIFKRIETKKKILNNKEKMAHDMNNMDFDLSQINLHLMENVSEEQALNPRDVEAAACKKTVEKTINNLFQKGENKNARNLS